MSKDLRTFLNYLEQNYPGDFVRITHPVDTKWEVSAVVHKLDSKQRRPVLLFEKVKGHSMPVIENLFSTRRLLALAHETTVERMLKKGVECNDNPIAPKTVSSGPVKDVIMKGEQVDLGKLPIIWHCEKDAGPYLNAGVTIVRDPDTGVYNSGGYICPVHDRRTLGIALGPLTHGRHIYRKMEERGKDLEAVICLGHHPAISLGAQFEGPLDEDEIGIMGALLGQPVEMVRCETVDLEMPAYSEIAIEGVIKAGVLRDEGPHAEGTGYYGKRRGNCVFEITAITHRHDAIYHDIHPVGPGHRLVAEVARESSVYRAAKALVPQVLAVRYPDVTRNICYVQIKKEYDGLGKNAAIATLAVEQRIEIAIVVDDDVDIYNDNEILWAIATRCDPGRSFSYIQDAAVSRLDPSSYDLRGQLEGGMKTKVAIDATKPLAIPFAERAAPPHEIWQNLKLEDYLAAGFVR